MKLDRALMIWILSLTFASGFLNAVSFLLFKHYVTHHTGTLTQLGIHLSQINLQAILDLVLVIGVFVIGAICSGLLFPSEVFHPKKRYGGILIYSSLVLLLMLLLQIKNNHLYFYLSFMAGIQNGMFVFYRGMIVRSTHMTGTLTDFGLSLGRYLKTKSATYRFRVFFQLSNLTIFLLGSLTAMMIYLWVGVEVLYFVVLFNCLIGCMYYYIYFLMKT